MWTNSTDEFANNIIVMHINFSLESMTMKKKHVFTMNGENSFNNTYMHTSFKNKID